ncbi:MAG: DNA replication/repair protein RecF [Gemmatimonadota bacterium]|nr:MAG: DNA replication/repair protein RecF [Gemmatimonadota bacterium]
MYHNAFRRLPPLWLYSQGNVKFTYATKALTGTGKLRLSGLRLRRFRNLGDQELRIPAEGVAIIGHNAQGKSNLLEAIYYLETFRSFRRAPDEQLIAFGEDSFRLMACLVGPRGTENGGLGGDIEIAAAYQRTGKRKKVSVEGAEPERFGDAVGRLSAVIFSPLDVGVVSDGPGHRRRYMDIVLSLNVPGYLDALQGFRHTLAQRNASLRKEGPSEVVRAWDGVLVESGSRVMLERHLWAGRWAGAFSRYYQTVSGDETGHLSYDPAFAIDRAELDRVEELYRQALDESARREARVRTTVVGPHRDDLRLSLAEEGEHLDLREFGSGGQRRTAALALRLVEAATIRSARGFEPLLLLDDAFAELDEGRCERVLALIEQEEPGQVILTAPKENDVKVRRDALPRWTIDAGRIQA